MKELIVWIILLNIDGILSTLLMLILAYICMFLQHKKRIQDWITSLSGIQIGAYLLVSEIIRIIVFYILLRVIFLLLSINSIVWMITIMGSTMLTTLFRWFSLFKHRKEIKKETQS